MANALSVVMKTSNEKNLEEDIEQVRTSLLEPLQGYLEGLSELLILEAKEALSSLKVVILLSLCLLPLVFLAWVSACGLAAYLAYQVSSSMALAILVFCLLQIAAIFLIKGFIKQYKHRLSFPYSRKELSSLLSGDIKNESISRNSTATAETPKPTSGAQTQA